MLDNIGYCIIQHLLAKKDHKDDINGIILFIYDSELKNLSNKILTGLIELLSRGLIKESENSHGQKLYQLSDNESLISEFLLERKK